jgi:hypothetical protein
MLDSRLRGNDIEKGNGKEKRIINRDKRYKVAMKEIAGLDDAGLITPFQKFGRWNKNFLLC